jgi:hypothetical protein
MARSIARHPQRAAHSRGNYRSFDGALHPLQYESLDDRLMDAAPTRPADFDHDRVRAFIN